LNNHDFFENLLLYLEQSISSSDVSFSDFRGFVNIFKLSFLVEPLSGWESINIYSYISPINFHLLVSILLFLLKCKVSLLSLSSCLDKLIQLKFIFILSIPIAENFFAGKKTYWRARWIFFLLLFIGRGFHSRPVLKGWVKRNGLGNYNLFFSDFCEILIWSKERKIQRNFWKNFFVSLKKNYFPSQKAENNTFFLPKKNFFFIQ